MDEVSSEGQVEQLLTVLLPLDTFEQIRDLNLPFLEPVETLKEICLTERKLKIMPWKEYRFHGQSKSLKAFLDVFLQGNGEYDEDLVLWITDHAFVCIHSQFGTFPEEIPGAYRESGFELGLKHGEGSVRVVVCSATLQEAMLALDLLFGLRDHHFDTMSLQIRDRRCPLANHLLEKMLVQSSKRMNRFNNKNFTPGQGRILAASGTRTNIRLHDCGFEDDGAAFLEALVARDDQNAGPAKLIIDMNLPFHEDIFVLCLNHLNLVYLEL
jgi:hypothetical protein